MKATNVKIEYLSNPIGLNQTNPEFCWTCLDGKKQTAYRIICNRDGKTVWDSGKVMSAKITHIPYQGKKLGSRDQIHYSVCLWDENGIAGEEADGFFEMGLLDKNDWEAEWITGNYKPVKKKRYPVDCFRKKFSLSGKVQSARLYASALGVYDVWIDGKRVEDFILAPGVTDYRKRVQVQTYDVTDFLGEDAGLENGGSTVESDRPAGSVIKEASIIEDASMQQHFLEIRLADGWFRGSSAAYGVTNVYGTQTAVIAQLEITLQDGSCQKIVTENTWDWCNDGPIRFADLKDGEIYDATKKPGYQGKAKTARMKQEVNLLGADNVYVKEHEIFEGKLIKDEKVCQDETSNEGKQGSQGVKLNQEKRCIKVLDFSQNIAGSLSFRIKGERGQQIRLFCTEILDENGYADPAPMQETRPKNGWTTPKLLSKLLTGSFKGEIDPTPHQEILFTCSGDWDDYKTSFTVFGFRYLQIESQSEFEIENCRAIALYSDLEETGAFTCSDARVNQFVENTKWSMKGNYLDIPTDCPTRERLGWTGDAQVFFDAGAYFMDTSAFFAKWMRDMEDAQYKNGLLPAVLPYGGVEMMYKSTGSSVGWADAVYLIPYRFYKRYGDKRVLTEHWDMMKKYGDYLLANRGFRDKKEAKINKYNPYIYEKGIHLGEWLEPVEFRDKVYGTQAKHPEECTAYLFYAMVILARIAKVVGDQKARTQYCEAAIKAREAYIALFCKDEQLQTNRQAKLVRPLALGILDKEEEIKKKAQVALKKAVEDFDYKVGTGFLSTPFLLGTLTDAGFADTAYQVLLNEKNPGWLCEVLEGSTTIWENWEGKDVNGKGSFNHYSPGASCQWLFDTVCGIKIKGERHFTIAPVAAPALAFADASYRSIYGTVTSAWSFHDGKVTYKISVPVNCKATVTFPGKNSFVVETGTYEYEI